MEFKCENCGWSKVVESSIFCEYSEKLTSREWSCEAWKSKNNLVTNADKIRHMSDEELAEWINKHDCHTSLYGYDPKEAVIDWLKQEVESDD